MTHDETLYGVAEKVKNFAIICRSVLLRARSKTDSVVRLGRHLRYHEGARFHKGALVSFSLLNHADSRLQQMYELYDPCTTM